MRQRERFIYAKIDVDLIDHPKTHIAGLAAFGVFVAAICYCRKHQTNGRIPIEAARALLGGAGAEEWDRLTDPRVGWFVVDGSEVIVFNYSKKNHTKEQIEASRTEARDRMRAIRSQTVRANNDRTNTEHAHEQHPVVPSSSSLSDQDLSEGESREGDSPPTARQLEYQRAYERGIVAGKKSPFGLKDKARADLHQAILVHARDKAGKGYRSVTLLEWIEFQAGAFAKWLATSEREEPKFWGSYQPSGWMRWLNDGRARPFPPGAPRPPEASQGPANGIAAEPEPPVDPAVMTRFLQSFGKGGGA